MLIKQLFDAYLVVVNKELAAGAASNPPIFYDTTSYRDPKKLNIPKTPIIQASCSGLSGVGGFYELMDLLDDRNIFIIFKLCYRKSVWNKIRVELNMPNIGFPQGMFDLLLEIATFFLNPLDDAPISTMVIHSYWNPDLKDFIKEFAKQNNMTVQEYVTEAK